MSSASPAPQKNKTISSYHLNLSLLPALGNQSTFCFHTFAYSGHFISMESYNVCLLSGVELRILAKGSCSGANGRPCPGVDGIKSHNPTPVPGTILSTLCVFTPLILAATFWGRHSHSLWCKLSDPVTTVALSHGFYVS